MSIGWKSIALTAVVAALASGAGTWGSMAWVMKQREAPSLHRIVHEELDLSADQDARIQAIEARFDARRMALEGEVRTANRELAVAIAASEGNSPKVQAAIDHFHRAMGDLQKATITHVFEMRAVLTPAQAETFDSHVVGALLQEAG